MLWSLTGLFNPTGGREVRETFNALKFFFFDIKNSEKINMGVFLCIDGMIRCIDVTMVTKFFTTYISIFQTFGSTCIWFCYVFKCWVILGHFMTSWIKDGGTVTSHNDVVNIEIPSVLSKDYRAKKYRQKMNERQCFIKWHNIRHQQLGFCLSFDIINIFILFLFIIHNFRNHKTFNF